MAADAASFSTVTLSTSPGSIRFGSICTPSTITSGAPRLLLPPSAFRDVTPLMLKFALRPGRPLFRLMFRFGTRPCRPCARFTKRAAFELFGGHGGHCPGEILFFLRPVTYHHYVGEVRPRLAGALHFNESFTRHGHVHGFKTNKAEAQHIGFLRGDAAKLPFASVLTPLVVPVITTLTPSQRHAGGIRHTALLFPARAAVARPRAGIWV